MKQQILKRVAFRAVRAIERAAMRGGSTGRPVGARRGFAYMFSGSIVGYVISFVALPVLSRLYGPEAYGVFTLVSSLAAVVTPFATLRFESAALLPRGRDSVAALVWLAVVSIAVTSVIYSVGILVWVLFGSSAEGVTALVPLWVFLFVALGALFALLSQLAIRKKSYAAVASRSVYQTAATAGTQIALSPLTSGALGLNAGGAVGKAVGILALWRETKSFFSRSSTAEMKVALRRYWRFPAVFAPSALLNSLGLQVPVLVIAAAYGTAATGQLGMAERITAIPVALVGGAVGQVLAAEFSESIRNRAGGYTRLFLKASLVLAVVAAMFAVAVWFLAPIVIPVFLGPEWQLASRLTAILAVATALRLLSTPLSRLITLFERARANLLLDVARVSLLAMVILYIVLARPSLQLSVWLLYGSFSLAYLATWSYTYWLVRVETKRADSSNG